MTEIKQGWLIAYGLSDHDLPSKWFEWGCWGRGKGFRDGSPFPPHPPFGHLLPRGRRFSFCFLKQWILQLRVNPSCRMTWGWGESGRRNSSLKYATTNGTKGSAPAQYLSYESIKNQCWWHQSTTNTRSHSSYCEEHQYQCAEHLQAIHKALTSNERKINISALSININAKIIKSQCTEHQHPKHSVFISKAHSISVQCTLRQQHWMQH